MKLPIGIEAIRQRPEFYFRHGVTGAAICLEILNDALALGASHCTVDLIDQWHIVSADVDWLLLPAESIVPAERLFRGMHPTKWKINGIRSEVFVGAFAAAAYIATREAVISVVAGEEMPGAVSSKLCSNSCVRSLVFTLCHDYNALERTAPE